MARFVLKRRSGGRPTQGDVPNLPGLRVLDNILNKALLVEVDEGALRRYESELQDWTVWPESSYSRPISPSREVPKK
jgi:hypothetical protein